METRYSYQIVENYFEGKGMSREDWVFLCEAMFRRLIQEGGGWRFKEVVGYGQAEDRSGFYKEAANVCWSILATPEDMPTLARALWVTAKEEGAAREKAFVQYCRRCIRNKLSEAPRNQLDQILIDKVRELVRKRDLLDNSKGGKPVFRERKHSPEAQKEWLDSEPFTGDLQGVTLNFQFPQMKGDKSDFPIPLPTPTEALQGLLPVFGFIGRALCGKGVLTVLKTGFQLQFNPQALSLDAPVGGQEEGNLRDFIPGEQASIDMLPQPEQLADAVESSILEADNGKGKVHHLFYHGLIWFDTCKDRESWQVYNPNGYVRHYFGGKGSYVYEAYLPKAQRAFLRALESQGLDPFTDISATMETLMVLRDRHIDKIPEFLVLPDLGYPGREQNAGLMHE